MHPVLVSSLTTDVAQERDKFYHTRAPSELKDFIKAVDAELRGVVAHYNSPTTAYIYRKGDPFALGIVGYANTKSKGRDDSPQFYVQAAGIRNNKYRSSSWQHNIVASTRMATVVRAAAVHLRHPDPAVAALAVREILRAAHTKTSSVLLTNLRTAYTALTGESGYRYEMGEFWGALRGHVFPDNPELTERLATLHTCWDMYEEQGGKATTKFVFVMLTQAEGQTLAQTLPYELGLPPSREEITPPIEVNQLPNWLQGRLAVLNMTSAGTYVPRVGLRVDGQVFFAAE